MTTLLNAKQLSLQIANKTLYSELTIAIEPGDIWGILGANGSGKTTLLHTLAGLRAPSQGEIYLRETNLIKLSKKEIAKQIGILFQDTATHFPQTVYEFCLSGRYPHLDYFSWEKDPDKKLVETHLALVGLTNQSDQIIQTLSGGELRRLAIAALLTQMPQVFLLDEPTNHLDFQHQVTLLNHFHHLTQQENKGIILSSHDINLVAHYCNKLVMLLGDGTYLSGPKETLLNEENLTRVYRHPIQNHRELWHPHF